MNIACFHPGSRTKSDASKQVTTYLQVCSFVRMRDNLKATKSTISWFEKQKKHQAVPLLSSPPEALDALDQVLSVQAKHYQNQVAPAGRRAAGQAVVWQTFPPSW